MSEMKTIPVPSAANTKAIIYIVVGILVIVFLFVFGKKILEALGLIESEEVKKARKAAQQVFNNSAADILNHMSPTMNDAQIKTLSDNIYNDLNGAEIFENTTQAITHLSQVGNDADMVRLIQIWGVKPDTVFGYNTGDKDFTTFIDDNLDRGTLNQINNVYKNKGITFKF